MRILLATPLLPPDIGGPATFAHSLITALPKRGVEISIAHFGKVRKLPPGIRHFAYFFMLWRLSRGCDAILALDPFSVGFPAALVARLRKKTFLLRVAGDFAWEQGMNRFGVEILLDEFVRSKPKHPIVRLFAATERYVARTAKRIIVPSAYFKRVIERWGIESQKIEVIYSAVEDIKVGGRKDILRGILQFDGKFIMSSGRLVPWKGFEALIEIVPRLLKKFPKLKLMIAGSGPDLSKLEKLIEKMKLENNVVLAGGLPREILLRYLKAADLFVLNTGYEGFSHQILEVLSVGVPVITTSVGGNTEVIEDGRNGLLVPYNNRKALEHAIVRLLGNEAEGAAMVAAGKKTAAAFSEARMVEEVERFLKRNV